VSPPVPVEAGSVETRRSQLRHLPFCVFPKRRTPVWARGNRSELGRRISIFPRRLLSYRRRGRDPPGSVRGGNRLWRVATSFCARRIIGKERRGDGDDMKGTGAYRRIGENSISSIKTARAYAYRRPSREERFRDGVKICGFTRRNRKREFLLYASRASAVRVYVFVPDERCVREPKLQNQLERDDDVVLSIVSFSRRFVF